MLAGCRPGASPGASTAPAGALRPDTTSAEPGDLGSRLAQVAQLSQAGRLLSALEAAEKAMEAFPDSIPACVARADALLAVGRAADAAEVARPRAANPFVAMRLARYLIRAGRADEARVSLPPPTRLTPVERLEAARLALDALAPLTALTYTGVRDFPSPELAATAGMALLALGRAGEAVRALEPVAASGQAGPDADATLGSALRSADPSRLETALQHFRRAQAARPGDGILAYEAALANVQLRRLQPAAEDMAHAARLASEVPEIHRDRHRLLIRLGDPTGAALARARYLTLMEDYPAARKVLLPVAGANPGNRDLAFALAEAHYDNRDTHLARAALEAQAKREPTRTGRREVLWEQFRMERELSESTNCLRLLDALAREGAPEAEVLDARVDLLSRVLRYGEAHAPAARLAELRPGEWRAHYQLGLLCFLDPAVRDRETRGINALRAALNLKPDSAEAHLTMGRLLVSSGRSAEALHHLYAAADLRPDWEEAWAARATALAATGDREAAAKAADTQRRLARERTARDTLMLPGKTGRATLASRRAMVDYHMSRGDYVPAARLLETLLYRDPKDSAARSRLIRLLAHARRYQRAFEERARLPTVGSLRSESL